MEDFIYWLEDFLWGMPFIVFTIFVGLYFTVRSGFFPFRRFGHILKNTIGASRSKEANQKTAGTISPWEAVCVAIGGSVGAGNISGVASAIAVGGPGAVFWMWLWAFFGMMVKLVEASLGCYYRSKDEKGQYYSGPMEYIEKGIGRDMGFKTLGTVLSIAFCIAFLLNAVQGSQAYTISEMIYNAFGIPMMVTTVIYVIVILIIVWSGTQGVTKFATSVVPFMCIIYVIGGLAIICLNIGAVPTVIVEIFKEAFTPTAAVGGFLGSTVAATIRSGLNRSINSNEAGQGSSPLVHGSADCIHPVRQGLWGSFEVFADTIIVCSVTALAILCTGTWTSGLTGATLSMTTFQTVFGTVGKIYLGLLAVFFGFTTTAGWYLYYVTVIRHLLAKWPKARDTAINIFKVVFPCINVVIVGYITFTGNDADLFWSIVGCVMMPAIFINLASLLILSGKFFKLFKDYEARYLGIGEVDPNFYVFYEDDPKVQAEEAAEKNRAGSSG